jgi:phosphoribosylformylglycinamidine synthase
LREQLPQSPPTALDAVEVYLIEAPEPLNPATAARAATLLSSDAAFDRAGGFFVTPRKGTISPWSSKAGDIFRNCGLRQISRVERGLHWRILDAQGQPLCAKSLGSALLLLHDRMTEGVYEDLGDFFAHPEPAPLRSVPLLAEGPDALRRANKDWGLALSPDEIDYLAASYLRIGRDPSDAELVMFSQVNSEHCRHKIFNADWIVDGEKSPLSLFQMIRNTHAKHPAGTLVAYSDNSGVLEGFPGDWWEVNPLGDVKTYRKTPAILDILCKVETHNHPTAISPFPGAATGVGGEIRDEGATGIGGRSKAGLSAFMVSHLRLPGHVQPWETPIAEHPSRMARPLDIMLDGPIGGAAFGNEFGRPQLCGLFRTLEIVHNGRHRGYHKPIMAAGGMGNLKREHVPKKPIRPGALILQLGGPSMKIGLGGGAASSIAAGSQSEALDFDSVQRGNPEMQRRCQQVIDACIALGADNPILSIHDIGAGGLSNGLPELVEKTGGHFHLRRIHNEDRSMSPMEIWCNESQERYVLGIPAERLPDFESLCARERCPFAVVGEATSDGHLILSDEHFQNKPIDMEMGVLLGKPPKMLIEAARRPESHPALDLSGIDLADAIDRVLRFPAVADKTFLITIADRSITGLVCRDQMVGPWQTPVADVAVTATTMDTLTGEAMAMGERTPIALLNAPASGRMAIGECLTNLAAARIRDIGDIKLSANWMVAAGEPGEDANLFDTVHAVGMDLCPDLGISIPVGKDSMSMRSSWKDASGKAHKQVSPLSLLVTGFAPVPDVRGTLTPDLKAQDSLLLLIDLGAGQNRLGGSVLAQVFGQIGDVPPDLDDPARFRAFFAVLQEANARGLLLSYHDRSDGGLLATLAEMAFAGRKGVSLDLSAPSDLLAALFSEELGAVLEVAPAHLDETLALFRNHGLGDLCSVIGHTRDGLDFEITRHGQTLFRDSILRLRRAWSDLSHRMQSLRDNPDCAREAYEDLLDAKDMGLACSLRYNPSEIVHINTGARPRMAILREQGINGHNEMAFAFDRAGFECIDVHMTDLLGGHVDLKDVTGLVACGGFSYGDVLGAGSGWARCVLYNPALLDMFRAFFARPDSFTLGVCNGCQMISQLKDIIPGAAAWPAFHRNRSQQFEARLVSVEILDSPSLFFRDMAGSHLPIPVAHGEGFADFRSTGDLAACRAQNLVSARYIDGHGRPAERYPANPNGSPGGVTAFTTPDGRATILMPHPERAFRSVQLSWAPASLRQHEDGPWMRIFRNARRALPR